MLLLKAAKKAVSKKKDPSQEYYDQIKAANEKKEAEMAEFKKQEGIKAFDANAELPKSPVAPVMKIAPSSMFYKIGSSPLSCSCMLSDDAVECP